MEHLTIFILGETDPLRGRGDTLGIGSGICNIAWLFGTLNGNGSSSLGGGGYGMPGAGWAGAHHGITNMQISHSHDS